MQDWFIFGYQHVPRDLKGLWFSRSETYIYIYIYQLMVLHLCYMHLILVPKYSSIVVLFQLYAYIYICKAILRKT